MSLGPNFFDMNPFDSVRDAATLLDMLNNARTADEATKIRALLEKMAVRLCPDCQGTKQRQQPCGTCFTSSGGIDRPLKFGKGTGQIHKHKAKAYQRDNLVPLMEDCPRCRGMGCDICKRTGQRQKKSFDGDLGLLYICPSCNGTGMESTTCLACNGTGMAR